MHIANQSFDFSVDTHIRPFYGEVTQIWRLQILRDDQRIKFRRLDGLDGRTLPRNPC